MLKLNKYTQILIAMTHELKTYAYITVTILEFILEKSSKEEVTKALCATSLQ